MMPPLVLFLIIVLIGWPLLKLFATLISLPKWRAQRTLRESLERDERYGHLEKRIIAETFEEGKGSPEQLALPLVAFVGGISAAFSSIDAVGSDSADLETLQTRLLRMQHPEVTQTTIDMLSDKRFVDLRGRAFELEMLRYPVCTLLTIVALVPALLLMACLAGLRGSIGKIARTITTSSRETIKFFALSLNSLHSNNP